ncbi:unnamed protein product [Rotaria sordida]|uniref:Phosphoinositide phospholipase C n=1 Tax=Rotaria sordida TaxID=392033 RepID=A0A813NR16_9BILA|nr:unnamed protein product [Rotaria sordida]CAF0771131.1 unnamed protein product [Rotaria sordida]
MDETQWKRIMDNDPSNIASTQQIHIVNILKRRTTFIKYKPNGRTYSRIYYLVLSEDAIHYCGSKHKSKHEACVIKDINQIRPGFTTAVWRKCLEKNKIITDKANLAFSILYNNNRQSLDLLAETEDIRSQWIQGLEFLINRYQSHMRTHREITDKWIWHLFAQADYDQSGQLSRTEVQRLLYTLNIQLNDNEIDLYFDQANIRAGENQLLTYLDKDEFLVFYKYVSQRPELLKIICQFNGSSNEQMAGTLSDYTVIHKLPNVIFRHNTRNNSQPLNLRKSINSKNKHVKSNLRRRSSSITPESTLSSHRAVRKNFLTIEQLKDFLQKEEHMKALSIEDCSRLIVRFEPSIEGRQCEEIGVDGFRLLLLHDEFCIMNPDKIHRIYQDMTQPITDYFIATSHNTYIQGYQVYGDCTAETYVRALRTGCRAVEIDCYDGDNMEPIVYHGNTLTTPIKLQDILNAIALEAFTVSPYPLFLNLENRCSYQQQGVIARLLKDTFKNQLLSKPLIEDFQTLPSPEQLKYKVIIRSRHHSQGQTTTNTKLNRISNQIEQNSNEYHPDLASLLIYCQNVSFTSIPQTLSTQKCYHSISLKESTADDLIAVEVPHHLDLIALTQHHLVRVYPGTIRQNSSNMHPLFYWTYGIQMVALNYQTNDESMCLQHGFFSDNGGCGYLLKPPCLLGKDPSYDPKEKFYEKGKRLQILLISGQHLPKENNSVDDPDISDPYVKICTYGIECDYTEHRTPSIRNNGLNPIWDYKITADIYCPELCLVIFQVRDHDRHGGSSFIGQACIPFNVLQLGYRHIKLKAKNGDYIHGTIFVHVKIDDI